MEAAVVSATEGVVRVLLGKLGDFLAQQYVPLSGVRQEIQELKDDLESMNACLCDLAADNDYHHSQQTRTWMKQVREVAYDAEDCIDVFWCHSGHQYRDENLFAGWLRKIIQPLKTLKAMYKLAVEVENLKTRAQKVSERRLRYKLEAAGPSSGAPRLSPGYSDLDRRLPALNVDESRLVGMRGKTKAVIKLLEDGHSARPKAVSIAGFGGLGKTTLAVTVYKSPTVQGIRSRAFLVVSQNYDLRVLLESLLKQLIPTPFIDPRGSGEETMEDPLKGIETKDMSQLVTQCRAYLDDKRYFIVLDDLWSPAAWVSLKVAFPDNDKQSRILITTRDHQVAESCCSDPRDRVYKMEHLPIEQSRKLFFRRVFQLDECPPQYQDLKDITESILKKCSGLPLAIVSIGGMLARMENKTQAEWKKMCDRLGFGLETSATFIGLRRIVSLSYHDLPYHLKACFLYLSVFREGYEIKRGPLVRRWAAEGFITGTHEWNLEEVAAKYLDEFVSRSIVTPTRVASSGVVRCCKVHDIMLEVVTAKCIQENFVSFLGNHQYNTRGHDKIRRLSVHRTSSTDGSNEQQEKDEQPSSRKAKEQDAPCVGFSRARSLLILGCIERPLPINFARLKLLRVLDLEGCRWLTYRDLQGICKLSLLRYLSLRGTGVPRLPGLVGRLKELMTLDVRETRIRELPETIAQLGSLKHLLAGRYVHYTRTRRVKTSDRHQAVKVPHGLRSMKSLQTIAHVDVASGSLAMGELGELSKLAKLCAVNCEYGGEEWKPFAVSLNALASSLRHLSINHIPKGDIGLDALSELSSPPVFLEKLYLRGKLSALPPWIASLSNLADLSLRENFLDGELVESLGKLPSLLSLKLYHHSFIGGELCFEQNLFPRLKQLVVDNLRNLDGLGFQGGAPNLESLTLAFLREPGKGIFGIENLPRLKEIEFFGDVIVDSVVEGVIAAAKAHPNRPRVYRDDRPMGDYESSS